MVTNGCFFFVCCLFHETKLICDENVYDAAVCFPHRVLVGGFFWLH